jgi:membrane protease YdiL (CAAX protease family)
VTTRSLAPGAVTPARRRTAPAGAVSCLGIGALLLRGRILALPSGPRIALLALLLGAVAVAAVSVPVPASVRHARPWAVLVVGAAAVLLATAAVLPVVPAPLGPGALALALLAAVAEEALFRRAMFGWLEPAGPALAIVATAVAFALIHVPLYGAAALPVDLGAGLLLSWQRWASGTWGVPAATHGLANVLAVALR